jgi:hypothetical protein
MSGIVVKLGNYKELAKAILHLKEDKDVAGKLGVSGARYVENNLLLEKIGLKMMTLFRKVLRTTKKKGITLSKLKENSTKLALIIGENERKVRYIRGINKRLDLKKEIMKH